MPTQKPKNASSDVKIFPMAQLIQEEVIIIGEGTQIDDFTLIYGGQGIRFGRFNHICSFVSIVGGGQLITGDYVGIAAGCRIITGTHDYTTGKRMVPNIPLEHQEIIRGRIVLEQDVFLGTNVIVMPNITIGEGAIVTAGSFVYRDVAPWTINTGKPARVVGRRPPLDLE